MAVQSNRGRRHRCRAVRRVLSVARRLSADDAAEWNGRRDCHRVARCSPARTALEHGAAWYGHGASRHRDRRTPGSRAGADIPPRQGVSAPRARCARPSASLYCGARLDVPRGQPWIPRVSRRTRRALGVDVQLARGHPRIEPGVLPPVDAGDGSSHAPDRRTSRRGRPPCRTSRAGAPAYHPPARRSQRLRCGPRHLRPRDLRVWCPWSAAGPRLHDGGLHGVRGTLRFQPRHARCGAAAAAVPCSRNRRRRNVRRASREYSPRVRNASGLN